MQQVREAAVQSIIAVCPEYKEEVEHVLDEWAEVRGLDFREYVPEKEVSEIIEILCAEIRLRDEIRLREEIIRHFGR